MEAEGSENLSPAVKWKAGLASDQLGHLAKVVYKWSVEGVV